MQSFTIKDSALVCKTGISNIFYQFILLKGRLSAYIIAGKTGISLPFKKVLWF